MVQWTTGNVGKRSMRAIVAHPRPGAVGCYAGSDDKVSRDAGELCGIDAVGLAATNDVDALLGRSPTASSNNPQWPDMAELVRILDPDWTIDEGHVIQIDGRPTVRAKLDYLPPPDFVATIFADFMVLGMIMTAMPAINAILHAVAAPPGIVTYNDLPLMVPRASVPA